MRLKQTKWIIGITFILIGIAIVVATTLPKSMQYYVTVDELMAKENDYRGKELKVAGKVVVGSIKKKEQDLLWNFNVENADQTITVSYKGAMPDTFKEGADVVVTGKFSSSGPGHVEASHVLAKCASRYEEKLKPNLGTSSQPSQ